MLEPRPRDAELLAGRLGDVLSPVWKMLPPRSVDENQARGPSWLVPFWIFLGSWNANALIARFSMASVAPVAMTLAVTFM